LTLAAPGTFGDVLWMLLILFVSLGLAGTVVVYVAYPRRGEEVPHAPWLGDVLKRGVASLPTIDNQASGQAHRHHQHG
jgi:hypothetical protein